MRGRGHASFGGGGAHDDLVVAVALVVRWRAIIFAQFFCPTSTLSSSKAYKIDISVPKRLSFAPGGTLVQTDHRATMRFGSRPRITGLFTGAVESAKWQIAAVAGGGPI